MENFITVQIARKDIPEEAIESVKYYSMNEFNCLGVEEFDLSEQQVDAILGDRSYSGGNLSEEVLQEVEDTLKSENNSEGLLKFFFNDNLDEISAFEEFIKENFGDIKFTKLSNKNDRDWNDEWRKHYRPIEIDGRLVIVPSWERESYVTSLLPIYIYPGMGFGTGGHETTSMCLSLLLKTDLSKVNSCLDFGCGSGILGIALKKINSSSSVTMFDIDENAMENTKQNIEENGLENHNDLSLVVDEKWNSQQKFDLVFANILAGTLIDLVEIVVGSVSKNGFLIISGILNEQLQSVLEKYLEHNLELVEVMQKNDWSAALLRKK